MLIKKKFTLLLILIFTSNCSFDNKTGIWGDSEKEKAIASEIEKKTKRNIRSN